MTTGDDFQAKLDADPGDWQTRLVFADWLQERGNPRAEGYRALGVRRLQPNRWVKSSKREHWWWGGDELFWSGHADVIDLSRDWYEARPKIPRDGLAWPADDRPNTRRMAEDAAALAFARLPPARRAELLVAPAGTGERPKRKRRGRG